MGGDQRLIGGDDMLAGLERPLDGGLGRAFGAAHQLDQDIDSIITGKCNRIVDPVDTLQHDGPLLVAIAGADGDQMHLSSETVRHMGRMLSEQHDNAAAHRAEPGDAQS